MSCDHKVSPVNSPQPARAAIAHSLSSLSLSARTSAIPLSLLVASKVLEDGTKLRGLTFLPTFFTRIAHFRFLSRRSLSPPLFFMDYLKLPAFMSRSCKKLELFFNRPEQVRLVNQGEDPQWRRSFVNRADLSLRRARSREGESVRGQLSISQERATLGVCL